MANINDYKIIAKKSLRNFDLFTKELWLSKLKKESLV